MKKNLFKTVTLAYVCILCLESGSCGGDDKSEIPNNPEIPITPNEPEKNNAMSAADQKEYLEKVALEFMEKIPASDFIEISDLGEYINKTYFKGYKWDNVGKWAEEAFNSSCEALGTKTTENRTEDVGNSSYKFNYIYTNYSALLLASNFTGHFVASNNRWMYESSDDLQFIFTDKRGKKCVVKLETSGNVKRVHALDYLSRKGYDYDYNSNTSNYYYDRTQCTIGIPERIDLSLTQGDDQVIKITININLGSIANEEFDISKNSLTISSVIELNNGFKFDLYRVAYSGNNKASVSFTMTKKGQSLVTLGVASDINDIPSVNVSAFYGLKNKDKKEYSTDNTNAKNAFAKIDIIGKVQIQGSVADVRQIVDCLNNAKTNNKNESDYKEQISKANNLAYLYLFYDGNSTKQAQVKLEPFLEENWRGRFWTVEPVLYFYDGTSYSTFMAFFNQEDFKQTIKAFKNLANNYASLINEDIKW